MALGKSSSGSAGRKASQTISRLESLRKDASKPIAFRMRMESYRELEKEAKRHGMTPGALVRMWVLQRLRGEDDDVLSR
jgi:predicted nucleic acid-binding Zn ribbon protein